MRNYPNPFNGSTIIRYNVEKSGQVNLNIMDITGHIVRTLVHTHQQTGVYETSWDGKDDNGRELASGIYIAVLKNDQNFFTRKLIMVR